MMIYIYEHIDIHIRICTYDTCIYIYDIYEYVHMTHLYIYEYVHVTHYYTYNTLRRTQRTCATYCSQQYSCTCIYIYIYLYVYIYVYLYIYTYIYICIYTYVRIHICIHICMYICNVHIYVYISIRLYVYINITHFYTYNNLLHTENLRDVVQPAVQLKEEESSKYCISETLILEVCSNMCVVMRLE